MDQEEYIELFQQELKSRTNVSLRGKQILYIKKAYRAGMPVNTAVNDLIDELGLIEKTKGEV